MDEAITEEVTPASNPKPVRRGRPRRAFPVAEQKYGDTPAPAPAPVVDHPTVVIVKPEAADKALSPKTMMEIEAGKRAIAKLRR